MKSNIMVEFNSKECRSNRHSDCARQWKGMGFIALCMCTCHKEEEIDFNVDEKTIDDIEDIYFSRYRNQKES
jgi:hypothetical protein